MIFKTSHQKSILFNLVFLIPFLKFLVEHLDTLFSVTTQLDRNTDIRTLHLQNQETSFDYIIVGSGSAGSILASRLSENSSIRVLLLEAGGHPSPILKIPMLAFLFNNKKTFDWAYRTVPHQNAALGFKNNVTYWPAGKVLGGSSAINGLIYSRGNVQGYDLMANRTGDPIWKMRNILNFYNKVENYNGWFNKEFHGKDGNLRIERPTLVPVTNHILRAGVELGYKIRDPNADESHTSGFAPMDFYAKNGIRSDAYESPLKKSLERSNLILRKYSFVTKLQFRPGTRNEVVGVEYERHGQKYVATARKETILSAGVLSTPKILMLSGIGPKNHLAEMNIPMHVNLPVGLRLQDKYGAFIGPFIVPKGYSFEQTRDVNISSIFQWYRTGTGMVGSPRTEATFSILSETAKSSGDTFAPDIHTYIFSQTPTEPQLLFGESFNFNEKSLEYLRKASIYGDSFFQLVTMSRAVGTGTVKLRDTNPYTPLIIDPRYLQHPHDMKILIEGIQFAVNLVEKTKAMQEIGAQLFRLPFPGCENYKFKSYEYYECLGRHTTTTAYKYCGTAPIGTENDPHAVVDSRFRVIGTKGLRVIDGSLLRINEVNTNDVTMRMIGELGAHVIKESWM